jgi:GNAT superfamily N-acetyltransferase
VTARPVGRQPQEEPVIEIVRAPAELAQSLTDIALAAKRHWRYPERWIEIWTPVLTLTPAYVTANPTYAVVDAGVVVGFYALLVSPASRRVQLDHLWVGPAWIGRGLGRRLFEHAVAEATALGGLVLDIEAEPFAAPFYCHMGARPSGERQGEVDGQPRVIPLLELDLARRATPDSASST